MAEKMNEQEAAAILCLLLISADGEIRHEELSFMLSSPFFQKHVSDGIEPHQEFLQKYELVKSKIGREGLEKVAVSYLSKAFPAFQHKTLALMRLIAEDNDNYSGLEKDMVTRVAEALNVSMEDVDAEVDKQLKIKKEAKPDE